MDRQTVFVRNDRLGQPRRSSPAAGRPVVPPVMTLNRVIPVWVNLTIWAPPFVLLVVLGYLRTSSYAMSPRPVKVINERVGGTNQR